MGVGTDSSVFGRTASAGRGDARLAEEPAGGQGAQAVDDRLGRSAVAAGAATEGGAAAREGCYLYALAEDLDPSDLDGEQGVDPVGHVRVLRHGELAAVTSPVRLDVLARCQEEADLSPNGWLANAVRAHERIVERAATRSALVPMRFGTVYPDVRHVHTLLAHRSDLLRDELARLRNHREWGVKVCGNGARPDVARSSEEALVSREGKDEVKGRGAAYLHRKEAARRTAAEHRQTRHALLRHAFETLDRIATESISAPPESQRTSGVGEHVLLNASYLVSCAKEAGFVAAVGMLDEELRAAALPLVLTGPWPAYHFVSPHVSAQLSSGYGHE